MLNIFKKNTIFGRNTNFDLPLYYDNITVEGETTQETRSGKNLLPNNGTTQTLNGITFTKNDDGTIVANGTATSTVFYKIFEGNIASTGLYFTNIQNAVTNLSSYVASASDQRYTEYGNGVFIPDGFIIKFVYIRVSSGVSLSNAIFKPMLEVGNQATSYEQYGAMPSPDYPSELVSVGYENLLKPNFETVTVNGITVSIADNGWLANGTPTGNANFYIFNSTLPAGTYTINGIEGSANNTYQLVVYKAGAIIKYLTTGIYTFILTEETAIALRLYLYQNYGTFNNLLLPYQLEKGTEAHSYISYGKYGVEIKINGKNLLDKNNYTLKSSTVTWTPTETGGNFSNTGTWGDGVTWRLNVDTTKKYTFVAKGFASPVYCYLRTYTDGTYSTIKTSYINDGTEDVNITFQPDTNYLYIRFANNSAVSNFTISDIQLEEGNQATSYEPYIGHTNLIILDNPLRSIGDTKDLLYIKNGMLYVDRKIGKLVLDGSETDWSNQSGTYDTANRMMFSHNCSSDIQENMANRKGLSNYFVNYPSTVQNPNVDVTAFNFHRNINYSKYIYFKIEKSVLSSQDVAGFKSWLSTHNTEVQYELATPTIETYELDIQPMIFDSLGYGTLSDVVSDPLITEELNGSYILELEYMKNGKFSEYLVEENIIKAHGEPFSIYSVEKDTDEKIKILAKHWVINEWDKDFILDSAPTDLTAQNALAWIQQRSINHSDISISGDCTTTSTARYVRKNMLSAIFKEDNAILTRFGGELSYNKNNVSVNKHRGSLSGLTIRQGKNLTGAKYYLDFSTVTTRLVPVGKDGLMLDEVYVDSPLINNYATPIIRKVEVNTTSKDELRSYCNKLYENGLDKPTVSIKIDFIELSKTDEYKQYSSLETAHLGDEVTAYIPSLNLNVSTRIVKTVYNDNLKRITALELGSVTPNIATSSINVEKNLQKQVEQLAANDSLILDEAKEEASNLIKHPFGGYIYIDDTTGNMYIMDTNDINTAQNVWRWGLGGLGFSSTGVNGTYGIAMTQDGKIVADYIKSGTLQSVTIKATNGTVGGYKIGENKLYAETYSSYNFDSSDLTAIRNYLMDEGSLSDDELIKYDIDGNGVVDSRDYVLIRNFIELGVTKNKSAKIIMQTGNNIFENAYILQDANANDILNINFNGFIYDHPNNGKFNLSGSKLTLTDINNDSMTISPNWLPKSVLSNWYSTSSTTLTDAKKHKLLVILGKPTSSSGIVSLIIPTDALSTSNQQFQCADESKYVAFNVRYNNDDVIITGAGRSSDGSILSAWTLL